MRTEDWTQILTALIGVEHLSGRWWSSKAIVSLQREGIGGVGLEPTDTVRAAHVAGKTEHSSYFEYLGKQGQIDKIFLESEDSLFSPRFAII